MNDHHKDVRLSSARGRYLAPLSAGLLVTVLAACGGSAANTSPSAPAAPTSQSPSQSSPAASSTSSASAPSAAPGGYISQQDYEQNKAGLGDTHVVLFFNADWCPTCQEANRNLKASKSSWPTGLTVVDIDYDDNRDLRSEYGVTYQHTFVEISPDGQMIKKWSGSETVDQINDKVRT